MEEKKQSVQEEQTREIFDELRGWNDDDFNEAFQELEIENCNISTEKKKLLVMLNMLDGVKQNGWFFATNQLLCELSGMKDRTLTRTKKYFKDLKIINFRRGCKEHSTDYKFNRKNIINLPKIKCGVLPNKSGDSPIVKSGISNSISDSYQVQHATFFNTIENGVPYTETYSNSNTETYSNSNTETYSNSNTEIYSKKESYTDSNINNNINKKDNNIMNNLINILIENNKELIENINRNNKELTTSILSLKNGNETNPSIETYKKEIEEKDNRVKTLQDEINKIQDEASTLVEKKDIEIENLQEENNKLQDKVNNLQEENNKLQDKVNKLQEENNKLQERLNKVTVTANGNETNHSSSIVDKILSHSLDVVTKHPTKDKAWKQEKALQETTKQEQSPKVDTKTTVVENDSNNDEKNYVLKKLECEIIKPFKSSIINAKNYEKLMKTQEDICDVVENFYTVHKDVITISDIKPFSNELRTVFQQKEEELQQKTNINEPSSKSNGEVQVEEDNTNSLQQNPSKEETKETTAVENSSKEDEAKYNQFQSNKETTPKTENCEEKKETTAEPSTANSKNIEVSKTDTPNDKEKTQEELDKELDKTVSSMFLTDTNQAVSTKKSEEVKFPETKVIPLREGEEKRQFQELVDNTTINQMLESYSALDKVKYEEILTEIRKTVTKGNYPQRIVQAYLNAIEYKGYYCNIQNAMKPLEDTIEVTVTATSTPKRDSIEEFIKDKVDNIEKNVKECGDELPFGNKPKSNHQDVEESNCYQSEVEKIAMAATCSYDESQDALF